MLKGGDGDDEIAGAAGADTVEGGAGADELDGDDGNTTDERSDANEAADTLSYAGSDAGVTVNLGTASASGGHAEGDTIATYEVTIDYGWMTRTMTMTPIKLKSLPSSTSPGPCTMTHLTGDHRDNHLVGGGGDDSLRGGAGMDLLIGGPGADMLDGGEDEDERGQHASSADRQWQMVSLG